MDLKTRAKIESLSRVTVTNGAAISEALSARNMLLKLKGSIEKPVQYTTVQEKKTKTDELNFYRDCLQLGTIDRNVENINWDTVAKNILSSDKFWEYVQETGKSWELWHGMNIKELKISTGEYRQRCYHTLNRLNMRKLNV